MPPPRRHKNLEELTPAEHEDRQQAAREGRPWTPPETDEYRARRAEVLRRQQLEDDPSRLENA